MAERTLKLELPDTNATEHLAGLFMAYLPKGSVVFLKGNLGAGKTTFVRGCLRAAGYKGSVKSPTFTLVEEYAFPDFTLFHFDLYRLGEPEELEWIGLRDYLANDAICFMEWPERGAGFLPEPDIEISLDYQAAGRRATLLGLSDQGKVVIDELQDHGQSGS